MKTIRHLLLAASFILACATGHAAQHAVAPGQNVQTVVDGAASGDVIRFLPGIYGDLTIVNKDLTLKAIGGSSAQLGAVEVNGSAVTMIKVGASAFEANDLPGDASKIIAIQGSFVNFETNAAETHLAYCNLKHLVFHGVGTVTDCEFNGDTLGGIGVDVHGTGTKIVLRNSLVHDYSKYSSSYHANNCIGVRVRDEAKADVINNIILRCFLHGGGSSGPNNGMGVYVATGSQAVILGNVIRNCYGAGGNSQIRAPASSIARYNILSKLSTATLTAGGITAMGTIDADPKFVGGSPYSYQLQADSPLKNAGPPDPQYNDRDGTRNDIGMYGGHNFIPDGRTTNKPIVLGLDVAPIAVPTGGTVTIESTGATVK